MQVIAAPSNLGLRPLKKGHVPGTWRAPRALFDAGLLDAVGVTNAVELPRPTYSASAQKGTRILNGLTLRKFNLALSDEVRRVTQQGEFVLVIGGDCSILLGALAGARAIGELALVHIDGHSDFRHPGNYDADSSLGAAAGMDLAMATGRGETIATDWPRVSGPLVSDERVIQLGERENRDDDFAWPDVNDTAITRIDTFHARQIGSKGVLSAIEKTLERVPDQSYWVHLDVDVLDQTVMPAVDSPGSPGIDPADLLQILSPLVADPRCCGMTVTVFDPDLDPNGEYAEFLVSLLGQLPFRD